MSDPMGAMFGMGAGAPVPPLAPPVDENAVTPENLARILHSDHLRGWRVDIETNSTIQADMTAAQQNMSGFVQGLASYLTAIGPAVQAGVIKLSTAADLLKSFARVYNLGRSAETAIEEIGSDEEMQQGQGPGEVVPPAPPQPDPEAEAKKAKAAADIEAVQRESQLGQAQFAAAMQKLQAETALSQQKMQLDLVKMQAEMQKLAGQMELMRAKRVASVEELNDGDFSGA